MALPAGTRFGPYEITAQIGAGGMGEVYRARDARLQRDVAIKTMPAALAADSERVARFAREAQLLAAVDHPNIAHVYGVEDAGGTPALVMELVEGEDLAARIARGPLPMDEAIAIARQLAEALDAAHTAGIIHRDLKPANIKVRPDGTVKVLDFGLAKAVEASGSRLQAPGQDVTQSPTITTPAMTQAGVILGTAAYMSPEQAKGRPADRRSDLWAFGCVLFEMLTGRRPFSGNDVGDTMASILKDEPAWNQLPASVPADVRRLLRRCLEKDPKRRLGDAGAARLDLEELPGMVTEPPQRRAVLTWPAVGGWVVAGVLALVLALGDVGSSSPHVATDAPIPVRFSVSLPGDQAVSVSTQLDDVAVSADGRRIAYLARVAGGPRRLFVRDLVEDLPRALPETEQAQNPFFSPDGKWLAYFAGGGRLTKVSLDSGQQVLLCVCGGGHRGATWTDRDRIILTGGSGYAGLLMLPASGGTAEVVAAPHRDAGEATYQWPDALPGGDAVLMTLTTSDGRSVIAARTLASGQQKVLIEQGSHARYIAPGHILYAANGHLWRVAFDPASLTTSGAPEPVAETAVTKASGAALFAVSRSGTLIYVSGAAAAERRRLVWVDRTGREEDVPVPPRTYVYPRISPDGRRVAIDVRDEQSDIWIWDLDRRALTRFTFDAGTDSYPAWSPDGRRLAWGAVDGLLWRPSDGSGPAQRLTQNVDQDQQPYAFTPDGTALLVRYQGLSLVAVKDGTSSVVVPRKDAAPTLNGEISPDGRWLAYQSFETGRAEVFVRPFPNVAQGQWQVSSAGGTRPLWSRDGRELFYVGPDDTLMRVPVESGAQFAHGAAEVLVRAFVAETPESTGREYDISPDGRRFLVVRNVTDSDAGAAAPRINVVLNWTSTLLRADSSP